VSSTHDQLAVAAIFVVLSARAFLCKEDGVRRGEGRRGEGRRGRGEERGGWEWEI